MSGIAGNEDVTADNDPSLFRDGFFILRKDKTPVFEGGEYNETVFFNNLHMLMNGRQKNCFTRHSAKILQL